MFVAPGSTPELGYRLTRDVAERVARNWWLLLLDGILLVVAGFVIFNIDWTVRSLATFIGAVFIVQGAASALTSGIDDRVRRVNVVRGLLSIATGVLIIVWPSPGIVAVAIILGAWLIVSGTVTLSGALAARGFLPGWYLLLALGALEIPLGVLALANPGSTLAALITVAAIWGIVVGVMSIVLAFDVKRLPTEVDKQFSAPKEAASSGPATPERRLGTAGS
jgi:uncharacterized membrane protein HdeD (DUF308 family)